MRCSVQKVFRSMINQPNHSPHHGLEGDSSHSLEWEMALGCNPRALLTEGIRRSPVELGILSHYLRQVLYIPGGFQNRISEPSTVPIPIHGSGIFTYIYY